MRAITRLALILAIAILYVPLSVVALICGCSYLWLLLSFTRL